VTKRIWKLRRAPGIPVWQRNYYEPVIRDEADWNRIHLYFRSNIVNWADAFANYVAGNIDLGKTTGREMANDVINALNLYLSP